MASPIQKQKFKNKNVDDQKTCQLSQPNVKNPVSVLGEKPKLLLKHGLQFKPDLLQNQHQSQLLYKSRFNVDASKLKGIEYFATKPVKIFRISTNQNQKGTITYKSESMLNMTKASAFSIYSPSTHCILGYTKMRFTLKKNIKKRLELSHNLRKRFEEKQKKMKRRLISTCFSID